MTRTLRSEGQRLLRARMKAQKLDHTEVAERIGMARVTVTNIVNGKRGAGIDFSAAIENEFGIPARLFAQKPKSNAA